jgi:D-alanyl-D-alanine carboxypeptidase-like protein
MPRLIAASVLLVLCVPATDALARPQHHHHGSVERRDGLTTIHTGSGRTAVVAASAAGAFKGFLGWLEARGYRIASLGCYNYRNIRGTNRLSQHAFGRACDINQIGRNAVTQKFPPGTAEAAHRFGLASGSDWRHPDTGHFELNHPEPTIEVAGRASRSIVALNASTPAESHRFKPCKSIGPECF